MFSKAVLLFFIIDPIGLLPLITSILSRVPEERRRGVLIRELVFALLALIAFLFLGSYLLGVLHITQPALTIAGAMILLLIALPMIFPSIRLSMEAEGMSEPFVVPIAVPLIAGPSALAMVMLMGSGEGSPASWVSSVIIAWAGASLVLLLGNRLSHRLGKRGLVALERLMGMLLVALSVEMFLSGIELYLDHLAARGAPTP